MYITSFKYRRTYTSLETKEVSVLAVTRSATGTKANSSLVLLGEGRNMECDAVVIGAGIEGSAVAYELAKRGLGNVLLLEQV